MGDGDPVEVPIDFDTEVPPVSQEDYLASLAAEMQDEHAAREAQRTPPDTQTRPLPLVFLPRPGLVVPETAGREEAAGKPEKAKKSREKPPVPRAPIPDIIEFYNRITGAKSGLSETNADIVRAVVNKGATVTTMKLAVIGCCLNSFHLGFNDRNGVYVSLENVFRIKRFEAHADLARNATNEVIQDWGRVGRFWGQRWGCDAYAAMKRLYRERDLLREQEGDRPIGPAAVNANEYRRGMPWPMET